MCRVREPPANIDAQGFPCAGWLEDALAEVAGNEAAVGLIGANGGENAQGCDADILGLVHHRAVERHVCAGGTLHGPSIEHPGVGDEASRLPFLDA
jgi:hypothetical protein